tara:strand:- start:78 stop:1133 length:1056 start_codon:yes stop_codon:yes gene_type:complete
MNEEIYNSFNLAYKDYNLLTKSDHWENFNKNFLKRIKKIKLSNFRKRNVLSEGLDDQGTFFRLVENLIDLTDLTGKKFIDEFKENNIGNPDNIYEINGEIYNYNDLFIIQFFFKIQKFLVKEPKKILEIGGGYGGLAHKLKKKYPKSALYLVDLPEAGLLQSYYLSSIYKEKKFFLYEDFKKNENQLNADYLEKFDFVILPPWCLGKIKFKEFFNLVVNTRSFMEIKFDEIKSYFNFVHSTITNDGVFYNVNKYEKNTSGDIIRISEYPYDNFWRILSSSKSWRQPNLHELIVQRTKVENPDLRSILSGIKKQNLPSKKQPKLKLLLRIFLDLIFKLIPRKVLEKLFKIYY